MSVINQLSGSNLFLLDLIQCIVSLMNSLSLSLSLPLPQRCHIAERRQHRCQRAGEQLAHLQAARAPDLCALWRRHQCRSVSSQSGRFLGEARGAMCQVADQGRGKPASSSGTSSLTPLPPSLSTAPGAVACTSGQVYWATQSARGAGRHAAIQLRSVAAAAQGKWAQSASFNEIIYFSLLPPSTVHWWIQQNAHAHAGRHGAAASAAGRAQGTATGRCRCGAQEVSTIAYARAAQHWSGHWNG